MAIYFMGLMLGTEETKVMKETKKPVKVSRLFLPVDKIENFTTAIYDRV
ncbi:MAG: hypothetical protein AAFO69_00420 [Bacteroidota bacterium]